MYLYTKECRETIVKYAQKVTHWTTLRQTYWRATVQTAELTNSYWFRPTPNNS